MDRKKQRVPEKENKNSNAFIPEELLVIASVHFKMLMGPQLLVTAASAGVWSTYLVLLLLCSAVREVSSGGLSKLSLNHTATD